MKHRPWSQCRPSTLKGVLLQDNASSLPLARSLLGRFVLIPIDGPVADLAAQLRRDHRWKLPDALQAAAAIHHGYLLATRNTADFPPDRHAFVKVPYVL